jgi:hypothetical protein
VLVDDRLRDWRTVDFEKTVLVVVRTVTTLTRLLDVLTLLVPDRRIQPIFTHDPANRAILGAGVRSTLDRMGAPVLPWKQATRTGFDLALAASENDRLHQLDAPVLLVPHGVGYQKYYPNSTVISGLNPERLMHEGRVVPAAIALAHPRLRERLRVVCPPAVPRSVVVGDPGLDRMLGSRHRAARYRLDLGAQGRRLVAVASTWGPHSLMGRWPDLPERLVAALPADEYRIVMIMHPGVWAMRGAWPLRALLSAAEAYGIAVVPPEKGWQAALTAADCVVSDQGSLSLYAAALDKPLLLAPGDSPSTVAGSALDTLTGLTPHLDPAGDLRAQIDASIHGHTPGRYGPILDLTFDGPGRCAHRLRPLAYRLLDLAEPPEEPEFPPVTAPVVPFAAPPALVVGAEVSGDAVAVVRYPDLRRGRPHDGLDHRHLVVNADTATVGQLGGATILCGTEPAGSLLAQWPNATMVATPLDAYTCRVETREAVVTLTMPGRPAGVDPLLLASLAYVRLHATGVPDRLRVGERLIEVAVATGPASPDRR